jgi:hypothetical protein
MGRACGADRQHATAGASRVRTGKPPRFANLVLGGGVTPVVGLRVGASVTHGGWRRGDEGLGGSQSASVVTIESEFAVRHTSVAGEWVRDRIGIAGRARVAPSGWFVQGQQTLTPRWFVAGRIEQTSSPALTPALAYDTQRFRGVENVVGFRLTPELTLRAGHRAKEAFGRTEFDPRRRHISRLVEALDVRVTAVSTSCWHERAASIALRWPVHRSPR